MVDEVAIDLLAEAVVEAAEGLAITLDGPVDEVVHAIRGLFAAFMLIHPGKGRSRSFPLH